MRCSGPTHAHVSAVLGPRHCAHLSSPPLHLPALPTPVTSQPSPTLVINIQVVDVWEASPKASVYPSVKSKGGPQNPSRDPACRPPNPQQVGWRGPDPAATPSPILPSMRVRKKVSACAGRANYIRSLEHVQVQLSLSYSRRGDLEISLTSPMGTRSTLVAIRCGGGAPRLRQPSCPTLAVPLKPFAPVCPRPLDISGQGYNNWIFMSTHFWDEDPRGLWILGLENKGYYFNTGERRAQAGGPAAWPPASGLPGETAQTCLVPGRCPVTSLQWVLRGRGLSESGALGWGGGPWERGPEWQDQATNSLSPSSPCPPPPQGRCSATRCCSTGQLRT